MTATGPDGFQLGGSDNAVAKLNVYSLRSLIVLIEMLLARDTTDSCM